MTTFAGPSITALGLAAARAVESGRPDRLIDDPLARPLFAAARLELPMLLDWPAPGASITDSQALHLHGSRYIGLRTRHYDDLILAAAGAGTRQLVLLGAGLDTRAFRLGLPDGTTVFELDEDPLLVYKQEALDGAGARLRCRRVAVGVDLRQDWPDRLRGAGFADGEPAAFVAEGLLAYLDASGQRRLLEGIDALAAPGSLLALDRIVGDPAAGDRVGELARRSGLPMDRLLAGADSASVPGRLRELGWDVQEDTVAAVAERYGRDLRDPFSGSGTSEPPWLQTVFVTAHRARL